MNKDSSAPERATPDGWRSGVCRLDLTNMRTYNHTFCAHKVVIYSREYVCACPCHDEAKTQEQPIVNTK